MRSIARIRKELTKLAIEPGPGIFASAANEECTSLNASITGPEDSPYYGGVFYLKMELPLNYPFEPPKVQFITPVYHPNIDSEGRICLDTLKPQPQGSWSPSVNINTLLLSIRLLLAHPNADDGLVPDITEEYKRAYHSYLAKAAEHTKRHAMQGSKSSSSTVHEGASIDNAHNTEDAPVYPAILTSESSTAAVAEGEVAAMDTDSGFLDSPINTSLEPLKSEMDPMVDGSYIYCCDGYTLIGCNPSSVAHLKETLNLCADNRVVTTEFVSNATTKRTLDPLPSTSSTFWIAPPAQRKRL